MARVAKTTPPVLSARALNLIGQLFAENSNLSVPAAVAGEIVEIRQWVAAQQKTEAPTPPAEE